MRWIVSCLTVALLLAAPLASQAQQRSEAARRCANGKSKQSAMWLSVAHPGLGEWYLNDWGNFNDHCPQRKFFLGFIPVYGWPGYLQVKSSIDASHCNTNDELSFR